MTALQTCRWHEFANRTQLEQAARRFILEIAERAIATHGAFRIALAGGNTPRYVYQSLRTAETDWSAWHIYFGDERCLPAKSPDRNSRMAQTMWLDYVNIPRQQIHPIPGELGPETAAASYAQLIADIDEFDLVLLGLGEDGHTASLFPGAAWEKGTALPTVIPIHDSPKPPLQRVSLSPARLSHATCVMYLVSGENKREAVIKWRAGIDIPASRITPAGGVDIFSSIC
ncbi:6-phosphogluconolactonase [Sideroxydans lithotrophicus]|uniref:6-phosphogluconolactonase n=1 Tax=Sideroxydans lithotrophicus (strain ES-1) TaxID=580332 RepID=D5CM20_SIDLE|nr:6-phosphogluconolactonase [Sideroxydans lithotrophicus]ADE10634.1 6-phosphogluconolactonase [Sideroxydans lithotrophicus ES-1]